MAARKGKPSAADRTVDMFSGATRVEQQAAAVEVVEDKEKERVSMEEGADANRELTFKFQEWATKAFGLSSAEADEYRVSENGGRFMLQALYKRPNASSVHASALVMFRNKESFMNAARVMVEAARAVKDKA